MYYPHWSRHHLHFWVLKYHQIEKYLQERRSDLDAISYGAKRFVTGLAKKVLLANNLGLLWTQISSLKNDQMSVLMAWIGIVTTVPNFREG